MPRTVLEIMVRRCTQKQRRGGGIEPLHVSMPLELKSSPSTSPTHPGLRVSKFRGKAGLRKALTTAKLGRPETPQRSVGPSAREMQKRVTTMRRVPQRKARSARFEISRARFERTIRSIDIERVHIRSTRDGTRTHNLLLRREAPYPLGHSGICCFNLSSCLTGTGSPQPQKKRWKTEHSASWCNGQHSGL